MNRPDPREGDPWANSWSPGSMDDGEIMGDRGGEGSRDGDSGDQGGGHGRGFRPPGPPASGGCLALLVWVGAAVCVVASLAVNLA